MDKKKEKFFEAPEVEEKAEEILKNYPTISPIGMQDYKVLFKKGKNRPGKKHVNIKILKQPISLLSNRRAILLVTHDWWKETDVAEQTKAIIEAFMGLVVNGDDELERRDYDIVSYSDLIKNPKYDWSKFSKVLPAETKLELK